MNAAQHFLQLSKLQQTQQSSIAELLKEPTNLQVSSRDVLLVKQLSYSCIADCFYLKKLLRKTYNSLKQQDYEADIQRMQQVFMALKANKLQRKLIGHNLKLFFKNLLSLHLGRHRKKQKKLTAQSFRNQCLKKKMFSRFQSEVILWKKTERLSRIRQAIKKGLFFFLLKQHEKIVKGKKKQSSINQSVINSFKTTVIDINTLRGFFYEWKTYSMVEKVIRCRKLNGFRQFSRKVQAQRNYLQSTIQAFQTKKSIKLLFNSFQAFKKNHKIILADRKFHQISLKKHFFCWLSATETGKSQKEINQANQIILAHFLEQKEDQKRLRIIKMIFEGWKNILVTAVNQRKQQRILQFSALTKEKEILLKRYFYCLRNFTKYQKMRRYYYMRLKYKIFQALKRNLINQQQKLSRLHQYLQNRNTQKYFNAILKFNQKQKIRVYLFQLKRNWQFLSLKLTENYLYRQEKAENYHNLLLYFKSFLGFQRNLYHTKKIKSCQLYLGIVSPIKRWRQRFNLRKFHEKRVQNMGRQVLSGWRLLQLRMDSPEHRPQDNKNQRKNQKKGFQSFLPEISLFKESAQISPVNRKFDSAMQQQYGETVKQSEEDQIQKKVNLLLDRVHRKRGKTQKIQPNSQETLRIQKNYLQTAQFPQYTQ